MTTVTVSDLITHIAELPLLAQISMGVGVFVLVAYIVAGFRGTPLPEINC